MSRMPQVLLVEDDAEISRMLSRFLVENGFRVLAAGDGKGADHTLQDHVVDVVVLDIMLPGEDGFSICRRLRANSHLPIIMLTARGDEIDRIVGLEMGADDYLTKPFSPRELLARIRAVLRRVGNGNGGDQARPAGEPRAQVLTFDGWRIHSGLRQLHDPAGVRIGLTGAEFDLLLTLCQHPRRVLSRDQLLDFTQGRSAAPFDRSIDVLVSRIRQKIEADARDPQFIKTVRLGGYVFTPEVRAG
ncbi:MAG: response regulator [Alphaproteobacteria bacterium]|nr:response regulator [Alphaproteobacteria bacterium]